MANDRRQEIELGLQKQEYRHDPTSIRHAMLELLTTKGSRGLYSAATVSWAGGGCRSFEIYGDFRETLARNPNARATQKAIDDLHAGTCTPEVIADVTSRAKAFYAEKAGVTASATEPEAVLA